MRYLLITHIPYAQEASSAIMDRLWAKDLLGLAASIGPVTVAAPQLPRTEDIRAWGPDTASLSEADGIRFLPLPVHRGRSDVLFPARVSAALRPAVEQSDLIHSSNLFPPYTPLWYGHDLAVRMNKRTLFVVAEDFYDMLNWEWVRTETRPLQQWRRRRTLQHLDRHVRRRLANASLSFLHTPAAVARYRDCARNPVHIRFTVHEAEDIIDTAAFEARCDALRHGAPLHLVAASRIERLKGIDFIVWAVSILKQRDIPVTATIYGQGSQLEPLHQLASRLGVTDQVSLPGPIAAGPELRQALAAGHLFLMPHLTTDFGRSFFDGMAAGLPVIAFRSLASQDTVRDRIDGLITPNADAEGLADAIAQYHADRDLLIRCASEARRRAFLNTKKIWNDLRAQMIQSLF